MWVQFRVNFDERKFDKLTTNRSQKSRPQTRNTRVAPVFLFDSRDPWIELWQTPKTLVRVACFLDSKKFIFVGYDANLTAWEVRWTNPGPSVWNRLAGIAGRNHVDVPVQWTEVGSYEIEKLRRNFMEAAAKGESLTDFVERDELLARLERRVSFSDFVLTWNWLSLNSA